MGRFERAVETFRQHYFRIQSIIQDRLYAQEDQLTEIYRTVGPKLIQYGIALIFIWGGMLKLLPEASPVRLLIDTTIFPFPLWMSRFIVGYIEVAIGLSFLTNRLRLGGLLFIVHQIGAFSTFLTIPFYIFKEPWLSFGPFTIPVIFDIEAIYILKNIALLGGILTIIWLKRDKIDSFLSRRTVLFAGVLTAVFALHFLYIPAPPTFKVGVYATDYNNDGRPDILATSPNVGTVLFKNTGSGFTQSYALPRLQPDREKDAISLAEASQNRRPISLPTTQIDWEYQPEHRFNAAHFFDRDNDGWEDLLLIPRKGEAVFLENVRGGFVRRDVGLDVRVEAGMGAVSGDYNRDGCKDVFIIQNGDREFWWGGWDEFGADPETGEPNMLMRGNCSHFRQADDAGISGTHWGFAASFVDFTNDSWPDIHIANDFNEDVLYINQKNGSFRREELGRRTDRNGMSSTLVDINRDGLLDVFTSNIFPPGQGPAPASARGAHRANPEDGTTIPERYQGNTLLVNTPTGGFVESAESYGIQNGHWGWSSRFSDFDNDGVKELYQNTEWQLISIPPSVYPRYWERRDDRFVLQKDKAFLPGDYDGVAALDYDNDGDLDLIAGHSGRQLVLYENTLIQNGENTGFSGYKEDLRSRSGIYDYGYRTATVPINFSDPQSSGNEWLKVKIPSDSDIPFDSRVRVQTDRRTIERFYHARTDHLSQSAKTLHFGLGNASKVNSIQLIGPDGQPIDSVHNTTTSQQLTLPSREN